jgi:RNA polymerase sigma-70 factor, ECF subfamily
MKLVPPPPPRQREQSGTQFTLPADEPVPLRVEPHGVPKPDALGSVRGLNAPAPVVSRHHTKTKVVDDLAALDDDDTTSSLGPLETSTVYDAYATFVWRSLQRMGVPTSDLEDALQEVFIVVHRKLQQYDAERAKLSTWLFGISLNVARKHRARSRLTFGFDVDAQAGRSGNQEAQLQSRQQAERLSLILGKMKPEHSATFVMFELEALTCQEIADLTGVPVGTVYSRLHKAREQFKELAERAEKVPSTVMRLARNLLAHREGTP